MVRQLVVTYLGGQRKGEARTTLDNVLDVLATMLELSEDDKVAVGLVTKWCATPVTSADRVFAPFSLRWILSVLIFATQGDRGSCYREEGGRE